MTRLTLATLCLLVAVLIAAWSPAMGQEAVPPAPIPPPDAEEWVSHFKRWPCTIETEQGPQKVWCYIVKRTKQTPCAIADINGDTTVDSQDFIQMAQPGIWGCVEETQ